MFQVYGGGRTRPKDRTEMRGFQKFMSSLAAIRSAARVAAAVENGTAPNAGDLRRLGIDPRAFSTIGHG
jgi:hypothetical protein